MIGEYLKNQIAKSPDNNFEARKDIESSLDELVLCCSKLRETVPQEENALIELQELECKAL